MSGLLINKSEWADNGVCLKEFLHNCPIIQAKAQSSEPPREYIKISRVLVTARLPKEIGTVVASQIVDNVEGVVVVTTFHRS